MRILKIIWNDGNEDLDMEQWIRNVIPEMSNCEVAQTEVVYE